MTGQPPERIPPEDASPDPAARAENAASPNPLFERLYAELRALADRQLRQEKPGLTLQPTALVHEAYLRLLRSDQSWNDEAYFFAAAAQAMRRILVERARRVSRLKHGGGQRTQPLDDAEAPAPPADPDALLALHAALDELRQQDPGLVDVVMLRYFAGLTVERTAEVLKRSERSVKYDWAAARAWLIRRMDVRKEPPSL
ncbi:MAG: ECF-type sigma factor [Phycisphaerales bacterium]